MTHYSTKQRKTLLDYLQAHADEALTARQIADGLKESGVSVSAVYRNLAELEGEEKIRRMTKGGSRTVYYQFTAAETCKMHLHLSCSSCGKIYHMDVPATNSLIQSVENDAGFKLDSANTVLYGICSECRK